RHRVNRGRPPVAAALCRWRTRSRVTKVGFLAHSGGDCFATGFFHAANDLFGVGALASFSQRAIIGLITKKLRNFKRDENRACVWRRMARYAQTLGKAA